jgi:hypothetical protein
MDETGRLVAVVLLASFAIERVAATVDFFMSRGALAAPEKKRKLVLVGVAAIIALGVVELTGIRILQAMKFSTPNDWIDFFLTWLVLVGGADKLGQLFGDRAGGAASARNEEIRPIQIFVDKNDVTAEVMQSQR